MSQEALQIGVQSKPRFEFRSFGQNFDSIHFRMSRLSVPIPEDVWERHSDEIYIMSRTNDLNNTKIRDGKMDIKTWVQTLDGLEQWNPLMKGAFPLPTSVLREEVFPAFQVVIPDLPEGSCTYEQFLGLVDAHPDLQAVRVHKRRFGYMVHDTICEYAIVLINGARVVTVSTESTEIADLKRTIAATGMAGLENINYLQAIKRVIGMISRPLANE
ncbi:MAG TPA: hypothetical protein P5234_02650 [Thermoanaerobaculaceae bacterium]|nr:hypothetical protein [Thermoanaerobaculaceae bacterium]HRS15127.1 hypothetical protein [Thermoanaerobaculaceae bacterium]